MIMDIKNSEYLNQIEELNRQIAVREGIINEKTGQLRRIYRMRSWKAVTLLTRAKRRLNIVIKRIYGFLILIFLLVFTLIVTSYLVLLKRIRKSMVFPGG